jgi:hypothetical protein
MVGVYAMIVKTLTFSHLTPRNADDETDGTQVSECGVLKAGQTIGKGLGTFIVGRSKIVDNLPKTMTARQKQKLSVFCEIANLGYSALPSSERCGLR